MLTQVVLQTSNPMVFNINAVDPDELVILKSISGLLPGDVTLFTGEFARSGGYYQGRRVGKRNPVFNLKLNPDYVNDVEISDVREMLYRQFYEPRADTDGVQVLLKDDRKPDRFFTCYTEAWQGDLFAKDTSVQISTLCVDAFLYSVEVTSATNPNGWLVVPLTYDGSADTGLKLELKVAASTPKLVVENNNQKMTLLRAFATDDIIEISTVEGSRFIRQNGSDIMASLTADSTWLSLRAPGNILRVYGEGPSDGKVLATKYEYRSAWWGV